MASARDGDALLLPARQAVRIFQRLPLEADALQQRQRPLLRLARRQGGSFCMSFCVDEVVGS